MFFATVEMMELQPLPYQVVQVDTRTTGLQAALLQLKPDYLLACIW
jgi:hypothetical protein